MPVLSDGYNVNLETHCFRYHHEIKRNGIEERKKERKKLTERKKERN